MAKFLLLNDVPLDGTHSIGCSEDLIEIHGPLPQLQLVLQMDERDSRTLVADELARRVSRIVDPIHIHLGKQVPRLRGPKYPVKRRAAVEQLEFVVVVVESKSDAV